jgi:DNA-directed RNA polymerase subunit RPC12/RpoP
MSTVSQYHCDKCGREFPKPSEDKLVSKLQNDLKKQVDRTRSLQDSVKGTQSQLTRIDKTLFISEGTSSRQE